jgi:O-antigen/teichoic acid export membrane protein
LSFFALGRSLSSPSSSLFSAVGKPKLGLLFTVIVAPIFLLSVWVGSHYGVIGVSIATTLVRSLASVAALLVAAYLLRLTSGQLYDYLKKPLVLVIFMTVVFYFIFSVLTLIPKGSQVIYTVQLLVVPLFIYLFFICLRCWDKQVIEQLTESLSHNAWSKPLVEIFKRILFL